jgi:hypothetical protein
LARSIKGAVIVGALCGWGCDDADPQPPSSQIICPGDPRCAATAQTPARAWVIDACPAEDSTDRARLDLTVALVDPTGSPVTVDGLVAAAISPSADQFTWLAATARPAEGGFARPVELATDDAFPLGVDGEQLVILVMDHSASLVGGDETDSTGDPSRASDPDDRRVDFFTGLVASMPAQTHFAVVKMAGLFATTTAGSDTPTTAREPILSALEVLRTNELGGTPLARGLIDAAAIADTRPDLRAHIVLFTDGVEDGDTSQRPDRPDPSSLDDAVAAIVQRQTPINVHVVHLQPAGDADFPLGRDAQLAELACVSGGDYHFADAPGDLHAERREAIRARLMGGGFRVRVDADLADPPEGGWVLDVRSTAFDAMPVAGLDAWIWW